MATPTHLDHKPILSVDDYAPHDGIYKNATDAESLSVGSAQYDDNEIAAKVFRRVNGRWSRLSEELPLHRVIDLGTVVLKAILESAGVRTPSTTLNLTLQDPTRLKDIHAYYVNNRADLLPKLRELKTLLDYFMIEEPKL